MARLISGHNKKVIDSGKLISEQGCNCRVPGNCVLNGKCLTSDLVYKNTLQTAKTTKEYIGLTSTSFKQRFTAHKSSFKNQSKAHSTSLSTYVWNLTNKGIPYTSTWSILGLAPSYGQKVRTCQLCLMEKTYISLADPSKTLNIRNEIVSKCRHQDKMLLKHW